MRPKSTVPSLRAYATAYLGAVLEENRKYPKRALQNTMFKASGIMQARVLASPICILKECAACRRIETETAIRENCGPLCCPGGRV